jgi:hypothetical protein
MKTGRPDWQFWLGVVLVSFVVAALTMLGGMIGVAGALQCAIGELSAATRQHAALYGFAWGIVPAAVVGAAVHSKLHEPIATFLFSAMVALFLPAVILYIRVSLIVVV